MPRKLAMLFCLAPMLVLDAFSQLAEGGTLITVVPSNNGVVIAADTRTTVLRTYCDGQPKLSIPKLRKHMVVFSTGEANQLPMPSREPTDICAYLIRTRPLLDMDSFMLQQADRSAGHALSEAEMHQIARRCVKKLEDYSLQYKTILPFHRYRGKEMFQLAFVDYEGSMKKSLVGAFVIRVTDKGAPQATKFFWREFSQLDRIDELNFGETEYLEKYVYRLGAQYLAPSFLNSIATKSRPTVSAFSLPEAKAAAISLINAARQSAKIVPPPTGIGGPIDVAVISEEGTQVERH